ncbi:tRNA 2-thiouridine(34) synthase MnmA [endosymbiont of Pachyrhynchus infernalis]|uniref:tRNA 2-thiouridine(34) synthase MnmA n=1 Tax=endosymbiont of Pachyrhynchus infernalis TaxID=1971488 RepID=UPI000DC6D7A6|nr:tRNA 2-thiouridine(34) synthase MnmA [endosymbiont of Pachyrhynchus infernalis]BBA84892.1 tRNA-specific 2-thiouridylase MnmA [endosymbiont of Pachyrhynchus infernalis]
MINNKKFVIVAISGGVDSAISAYILKNMGYYVEGIFMKNWNIDDNNNYCNSEEDFFYAKLISSRLNIKLNFINFSKEYWEKVFKITLDKLKLGLTPNPDILCNKEIKFNLLIKYVLNNIGANYISTGHYVKNIFFKNKNFLLKSIDKDKDQSYFLYTLNNDNLKFCLFPLGWMYKKNVRELAKKLNFENFDKKSSTGICFIGEKNFRKFISKFIPLKYGNIITSDNINIGTHNGIHFYTIGQRYGLNIGGIKKYLSKPWYIIDKNVINNTIIVSQDKNHPNLLSKGLIANSVNLINEIKNIYRLDIEVKLRYSKNTMKSKIEFINNNKVKIIFNKLYGIVVPGQSVVFYINEICIGGAIIESNIL